jgi:hypothetical protein
MIVDVATSIDATRRYNEFVAKCEVSPLDYLVWHALIIACVKNQKSDEYIISASIRDIGDHITVHKEKIRRSLLKLRNKELAQQISGQWIYRVEGLNLLN